MSLTDDAEPTGVRGKPIGRLVVSHAERRERVLSNVSKFSPVFITSH